MISNKKLAVAVSGAVLLMAGQIALADSTTDIVDALVGKGVLTEEEGKLITKGHETKKKATMDAKFKDGFVLESADGNNSIKIGGRLHADYRSFNNGTTNTDATQNSASSKETNTFDIRRARLELSGTYRKYYDFLLSADITGGTNGNVSTKDVSILDQAFLNIKWFPKAMIKLGQFKSAANGIEKMTSSNNMDFQERSWANQLSANEDRGIQVGGSPITGVTYALGVMGGEGAKGRNDANARVEEVEYVGKATVNFAQLMDNKEAVLHAGGWFSSTSFDKNATLNTDGIMTGNWLSGSYKLRTQDRGFEFLSLPGLTGVTGVSSEIDRQRYGLEFSAAQGPVKLQGEYVVNNFSGDINTTTTFDSDIKSYYVQAMYLITGEKYADFYKEGIYGAIKPKNEFNPDTFSGGAWEIGARYSRVDAKDFIWATTAQTGMAAGVSVNQPTSANTLLADAWTVGVKFVPNNNTRLLLNASRTSFDTPVYINGGLTSSEVALTTRIQFMF